MHVLLEILVNHASILAPETEFYRIMNVYVLVVLTMMDSIINARTVTTLGINLFFSIPLML